MYSISIFYFTFYLFFGGGGCVHTQRTPLPTGLGLGRAVDAVRFTITRRQRRQLGLHAAMEWSGWLVAADKTGKLIGSAINKTCQLDPSPGADFFHLSSPCYLINHRQSSTHNRRFAGRFGQCDIAPIRFQSYLLTRTFPFPLLLAVHRLCRFLINAAVYTKYFFSKCHTPKIVNT